MFSPSRYRSIHYSKFQAASRLLTRPIPAMFRDNHMGPFSSDHTLAERGDCSHPHTPPPGQKCGMPRDRVDRTLVSSKAVSKLSNPGERNGHHADNTGRSKDIAK